MNNLKILTFLVTAILFGIIGSAKANDGSECVSYDSVLLSINEAHNMLPGSTIHEYTGDIAKKIGYILDVGEQVDHVIAFHYESGIVKLGFSMGGCLLAAVPMSANHWHEVELAIK